MSHSSKNRTAALVCLALLFTFSSFHRVPAQAQAQVAAPDAVQQANEHLVAAMKNGPNASLDTRATLVARHAALETLFRNTPAKARSYALDAATRAALLKADASYAGLLEQEKVSTGTLSAVVGDDFVNHASSTHYMLHTMTGDITLAFTTDRGAGLERMLRHMVTVSGLGLEDVIAAETIREASPKEIHACEVQTAPTLAAAKSLAGTTAERPSAVAAGAATAACSDFGNQTTAILILNFTGGTTPYPDTLGTQAYWNTVFNGPAPSVADYVKEASYGQTTAVADVYGPITVPQVYDCTNTDAMTAAAFTAATGTVDFTKYNRYILVFPVATCNFGGLDTLSCLPATTTVPQQYSVMWYPVTPNYTATFPSAQYAGVSHEYGHALGLNHGNSLDFGALSLGPLDYTAANPGTVNGTGTTAAGGAPAATAAAPTGSTSIGAINTEYGDNYSMMGTPWNPSGPYSGEHKTLNLGWLAGASTQVVTASGNFSVAPVEATTGLRTLQVLRDPASSSWVWVEYHQPQGTYEPLSLNALPTNNLTSGAQLRYQDGFGKPLYTLLMDMAPTAAPNNFYTSDLLPGSSWSDPFSLLTISVATPTATTLPVTVSYDTPCATVALSSSTLAAAGSTGTVTITAPSTCNWTVSSNATWITFSGATTGTGNGTVNFTSAANTATAQRNSYITAQRQSLPVVQLGTGINLVSLTPTAALMAPSQMSAYTFTVNDPLGTADFAQLNVNFVGGPSQDCAITVNANGTANGGDMTLTLNGAMSAVLTTGNNGTLSNTSCTLDGPGSSLTMNGNTVTITLGVSFPASFLGAHQITASAAGATTNTATLPLGYVNVAAITGAAPAVTIAPGFGNQGTTVPVTLTGTNTAFSGATTVTLTGPGGGANGITVTGIAAASATSLTANLVIPTATTAGAYTVTATTGAQTASATFTVNVPPVPTVSIAPNTGNQGTTVPFTITGINTAFTGASTVTGGVGMVVTGLTFVNANTLTGSFVIAPGAATGPQTVTITSGAEVDTVPFTVMAAGMTSISLTPTSGAMGSTVPVTITGTNTAFTAGSTIAVSGLGVTAANVAYASPTSLTANLVLANVANAGPRTVTVTSGAEVDTAIFTVTVAPTPKVTISPTMGSTGSTVPVTITGINTAFSPTSTVSVSGTGITVNSVAGRDSGFLSANLVIASTAAAGPYTITVTSGTQVVSATFTVAALLATKETLTPSAASILPGQTLTLSATVSTVSGTGTPGGLLTFVDRNSTSPVLVTLGTVSLTAGAASLPLANLSLGAHNYSLQYMGDNTTYAPSNSTSSVTVTVAKGTPGVALSGVPTGPLYPSGASGLSFTATVSGGTTGVTPTGSVIFSDGATALSTVNVNTAGVATLTGVTLATGTHSITAAYSGDKNFTVLTSAAQAVAVQDFSLALTTGTLTASGSQSLASTLTVTPGSGGFTQAIALSCTGAPANSSCVVTPASVTPGTANATATVQVTTISRSVTAGKTGAAVLLFGVLPGVLLLLRRRRLMPALLVVLAAAVLGASGGCGGSSHTATPTVAGTPAGTYTLTITGTATGASTLTHTSTLTLTVN
jgi:hypothetical protein